jgi:LacI family transcriptional regulator
MPAPDAPTMTIRELARRCGLSATTVSQALNLPPDKCRIAPETRALVVRMAAELGYRPDWRARTLATGRSQAIGLLHRGHAPFIRGMYAEIIMGFARTITAAGYHLAFVPLIEGDPAGHEMLRQRRVDGCVVLAHLLPDVLDALAAHRLPAVAVKELGDAPYPHLEVDDAQGMRLLAEHLRGLGHRRVAYLPPEAARLTGVHHHSVALRARLFPEAAAAAGLVPSVLPERADAAAEAIATRGPAGPTAVIGYDALSSAELLQALAARGVACPRACSVATFNDDEWLSLLAPPLSTIRLPHERMGIAAADLLLRALTEGGAQRNERHLLPVELVARASTAPPPA